MPTPKVLNATPNHTHRERFPEARELPLPWRLVDEGDGGVEEEERQEDHDRVLERDGDEGVGKDEREV